jgi:hypothetical protein
MYSWYEKPAACYAYLEDVNIGFNVTEDLYVEHSIRKSRWFTRGWTLQELIAPSRIIFFSRDWLMLGTTGIHYYRERSLLKLLSDITTIPQQVLADSSERKSCSVARKMSWAAGRETTREEDMAYCLLGIFDVNMPLLYGEGTRAFIRLQEEILKETDDQSLFAWDLRDQFHPSLDLVWKGRFGELEGGILASRPAFFAASANVVPFPSEPDRQPYTMTNKGLRIELRFMEVNRIYEVMPIALLDCHYEDDFSGAIGIPLEKTTNTSVFTRSSEELGGKWGLKETEKFEIRTIYLTKRIVGQRNEGLGKTCLIRWASLKTQGYQLLQISPSHPSRWNERTNVLNMMLEYTRNLSAIATSTIVFCSEGRNSCFAVVLSLMYRSKFFHQRAGPNLSTSVKVMPRPIGVPLREWLEKCETLRIYPRMLWTLEEVDDQVEDFFQHPDKTESLNITATVALERMLNQDIVVLDITCQ